MPHCLVLGTFILLITLFANSHLNRDTIEHNETSPTLIELFDTNTYNAHSNNSFTHTNLSLTHILNNETFQVNTTDIKPLKMLFHAAFIRFDDEDDDDIDVVSEFSEPNEDRRNLTDKITNVIIDVVQGLDESRMVLVIDQNNGNETKNSILQDLQDGGLLVSHYIFNCSQDIKYILEDGNMWRNRLKKLIYVIHVRRIFMEDIVLQIKQRDSMSRRHIFYIFISPGPKLTQNFKKNIIETMKIIVIVKSRPGVYQILYNQGSPKTKGVLQRVNWWSLNPIKKGLFQYPLLPPAFKVYSNFGGRNLTIPILHKPPWNFVYYNNNTIDHYEGGRDDKLLRLLASKLNFNFIYIDPPDRNQGSFINGTYTGALGLVKSRKVDMFMGDLTLTYERNQAVEFTFFTLADSEAFLTHAPGTLNEALALIRPFHWKVWPPLILSAVVAGPVLYFIIKLQLRWRSVNVSKSNLDRLFGDCVWFILVILLKQNGKFPNYTTTGGLMALLFSLSATYVIVDLYSANLTSILARPRREQAIRNLEQLVEAMEFKQYQTLVEKNSASQSMLENGTGSLIQRIWSRMQRQSTYLIDSNEIGMLKVREKPNHVLLGGRETLFYDAKRFGSHNYHLGEKLNTRYSAIAVQMGCPYIENFNMILLRLFEGGIIDKITEDEYQDLINQVQASNKSYLATTIDSVAEASSSEESDISQQQQEQQAVEQGKLKPLSMKTLQGCFYILFIGHAVSAITFSIEVFVNRQKLQEHKMRMKTAKSSNRLYYGRENMLLQRLNHEIKTDSGKTELK